MYALYSVGTCSYCVSYRCMDIYSRLQNIVPHLFSIESFFFVKQNNN